MGLHCSQEKCGCAQSTTQLTQASEKTPQTPIMGCGGTMVPLGDSHSPSSRLTSTKDEDGVTENKLPLVYSNDDVDLPEADPFQSQKLTRSTSEMTQYNTIRISEDINTNLVQYSAIQLSKGHSDRKYEPTQTSLESLKSQVLEMHNQLHERIKKQDLEFSKLKDEIMHSIHTTSDSRGSFENDSDEQKLQMSFDRVSLKRRLETIRKSIKDNMNNFTDHDLQILDAFTAEIVEEENSHHVSDLRVNIPSKRAIPSDILTPKRSPCNEVKKRMPYTDDHEMSKSLSSQSSGRSKTLRSSSIGFVEKVFEPGDIGMNVDVHGVVDQISKGKAAHNRGIQLGWRIVSVNQIPFERETLDTNINGDRKYTIAFSICNRVSSSRGGSDVSADVDSGENNIFTNLSIESTAPARLEAADFSLLISDSKSNHTMGEIPIFVKT